MWEVTADRIVATPSSLQVGCVIRVGKDGPVRFARLTIPLAEIPLDDLWAAHFSMGGSNADEVDEPLWQD